MSVIVSPFTLAGSAPLARTFSDNFNRANTTAMWGNQWLCVYTQSTGSFLMSQNIPSMTGIDTNHGRFRSLGTGAGGSTVGLFMIPRSPIVTSLYGQRQFAQATYVNGSASAVNPMRSGPGVFLTPENSAATCSWEIISIFDTGNFAMGRGSGSGRVIIQGGFTLNAGDVLRIEAIPGSGTTTINTYRNGTQVDTRSDNTGPIGTGVPGFNFDLADNGAALVRFDDWDDFSCGPI